MLNNPDFYPTPRKVIAKMLAPYIKRGHLGDITILEPEAGKADILDYIEEYKGRDTAVYCIEKDPNLQYIIQEKGHRLIGSDFLAYTGDYNFDLIVMNPPFSNGDEHLLKAWDILHEGDIVCLLNSETLHNPYTASRALLKGIVAQFGTTEELGGVFTDAERKTPVNVTLVRLKKTAEKSKFEFEFKNVTKEGGMEFTADTLQNPIATRDIIGNMITQHTALKQMYVKFMEAYEGLMFYSQGLLKPEVSILKIAQEAYDGGRRSFDNDEDWKQYNKGAKNRAYNTFNDSMKHEMWSLVIDKIEMKKYMTNAVRQKFNEQRQRQGCMDFTKENIADFVEMLFANRFNIMNQAVVDVFDMFTKYHDENRCHIEGWKTNDKFKVNQKIILPNWVTYGQYMNQHDIKLYGDKFGVNYCYQDRYADIDKVMCHLTGTPYDDIMDGDKVVRKGCFKIYDALKQKFEALGKVYGGAFDGTCESEFFDLRFYKKGTLHITFKDERLWQEFNLQACAGKNWLPENEMKQYQERCQKGANYKQAKQPLALTI